jgi:hypothetical protein
MRSGGSAIQALRSTRESSGKRFATIWNSRSTVFASLREPVIKDLDNGLEALCDCRPKGSILVIRKGRPAGNDGRD